MPGHANAILFDHHGHNLFRHDSGGVEIYADGVSRGMKLVLTAMGRSDQIIFSFSDGC